jgi:hypothetical protein
MAAPMANLVLRNLSLDGNTWQDSPSVEEDLFVPAAEVDIVVATRRFTAAFSYVFWGREFIRVAWRSTPAETL